MKSYVNKLRPATATEPVTRRSFCVFLMESDIKPLVFLGKCIDYFGVGAVVGFILGSATVFGLAVFDQLPYAGHLRTVVSPPDASSKLPVVPPAGTPAESKKIMVRGVVTTDGTAVVKEPFQVGVVQDIYGEFTNGDGTYHLEVPRQSRYKVAFWKGNYENLRVVELLLESENKLSDTVWLPREVNIASKQGRPATSAKVAQRGRKSFLQDAAFRADAPPGTRLAFAGNAGTFSLE